MGSARESAPALLRIGSMSPAKLSLSRLRPRRAGFRFAWRSHCTFAVEHGKHRWCLLPTNLPLPASFLQFVVAGSMDLYLSPSQHILRRHIADRAVQAHGVVVLHITLDQTPRIVQSQWRKRPNAFPLERLVPTFDLAIRLRIKRRGAHVRHSRDTNKFFEVARHKLRPIVRDNPRSGFRILLLGMLQNHLDVGLLHGLAQIPMQQETTVPIQDAAQVVERTAQVDVRNINMPVLMRLWRLLEAGSLA